MSILPEPVTNQIEAIPLLIRTHEAILYRGRVKALTSYNDKGIFDVLPEHTNFISLVSQTLVIHEMDGKTQEIPVNNGVMRVQGNAVEVYLGIKR